MNIVAMKMILVDIHFLTLASVRVLVSMFFILIYMTFKKIKLNCLYLTKILIISFFSIYLNLYFTFLSMSHLKGTQIVFINALAPFITLLFSFVFKEKIYLINILSAILCFISFLITMQHNNFDIGVFYMILGLSCYAFSHILTNRMKIPMSLSFVFYQLLFGFIMLFTHCLITKKFEIESMYYLNVNQWLLFIVFSGFGFAYIQAIYFEALMKVGPMLTSVFLSFNPIVTYLGSILFLKEDINIYNIVGIVFVISSISLSCYCKMRHVKT